MQTYTGFITWHDLYEKPRTYQHPCPHLDDYTRWCAAMVERGFTHTVDPFGPRIVDTVDVFTRGTTTVYASIEEATA